MGQAIQTRDRCSWFRVLPSRPSRSPEVFPDRLVGGDFKEEFRAGRLVAFCTSSDGTFTMKLVRRPLTPAEEKVLVAKECFRYDVRDGRLYWDNANCLPSEDQFENAEDDEHGWLEIPNGPYRVTVHALDWFSIPDAEREVEADISHYIVRFESVSSLEEIPVPKELPWLLASKSWHEKRLALQSANPEAESSAKGKN